jgi:AcrR family transcriptional regulator
VAQRGTIVGMTAEPGLRERKKLETREHLARTAVRMFLERGFDEVSVAEIAEAAGVSKMTVFNHFPAKEELVFELGGRPLPDLAGAVRDRAPGQSAVAAVRALVREDFPKRNFAEGRTEIAAFLRMAFRSPTLMRAFGSQWQEVQFELASVLAEAIGQEPPPADLESRFFAVMRGEVDAGGVEAWLREQTSGPLSPQFAAGQIVSTLQQVTMTNLVRMAAGMSPEDCTEAVLRDVDLAFGMLESGIGDFAVREA